MTHGILPGSQVTRLSCFKYHLGVWFAHRFRPLANQSHFHRWTLGSIFFLASFAAVMGPMAYVKHLLSAERLPFTSAYFGSLGLSMYFALGVRAPLSCLLLFASKDTFF